MKADVPSKLVVRALLGSFLDQLGGNLNTVAIGLGILLGGVLETVRDLLSSLLPGLSGLLGIGEPFSLDPSQ